MRRLLTLLLSLWLPQASASQSLATLLPTLLAEQPQLHAARAELAAAESRAQVARSRYLPDLTLTAAAGLQGERDNPDYPPDFSELNLKLNQRLWDFGVTANEVAKAWLSVEERRLQLRQQEQKIIGEAASLYLELVYGSQVVTLAEAWESLARERFQLEEYRLQQGVGSSTALIQAKGELAAAEAKRLRHAGKLQQIRHQFEELFGFTATNIAGWPLIEANPLRLPADEATLLQQVASGNHELRLEQIKQQRSQLEIDLVRAQGYRPTLDLTLDAGREHQVAGVLDSRDKYSARIELKMPFNFGHAARHRLDAAIHDQSAQRARLEIAQQRVTKSARDAWQRYTTAVAIYQAVAAQRDYARNYEALLREEQSLGIRSQLEIITAAAATLAATIEAIVSQLELQIHAIDIQRVGGELTLEQWQ
jgi:outer membrane protein